MKLALHRSLIFWSGLLTMGFICWAWWRSGTVFDATGTSAIYVGNLGSGIFVSHDDAKSTDWHWVHQPIVGGMPLRWAPPCFVMQTRDMERSIIFGPQNEILGSGRPGNWSIFLPHWSLLIAVAIPWSALLIWRTRRRRRKLMQLPP